MIRDLRDPSIIGEKLLADAITVRETYGKKIKLAEVWDIHVSKFLLPDYATNQTSIEKYGKPSDLKPAFMEIQVR
jgi:hypothetical protein